MLLESTNQHVQRPSPTP